LENIAGRIELRLAVLFGLVFSAHLAKRDRGRRRSFLVSMSYVKTGYMIAKV